MLQYCRADPEMQPGRRACNAVMQQFSSPCAAVFITLCQLYARQGEGHSLCAALALQSAQHLQGRSCSAPLQPLGDLSEGNLTALLDRSLHRNACTHPQTEAVCSTCSAGCTALARQVLQRCRTAHWGVCTKKSSLL